MTKLLSVRDMRSFSKDDLIEKKVLADKDYSRLTNLTEVNTVWWLPIKDSKT